MGFEGKRTSVTNGDYFLKILIFGADGMLGTDLVKVLEKDFDILKSLEKDLDITDRKRVEEFVISAKPQWTINAAAYTDVDGCETNKEKAFLVNAKGPGNIAIACAKGKSKLIHFSTDYVFDGTKKEPYVEDDPTNPINVYGQSKLEGEKSVIAALKEHYIVRTEWLYGKNGKHFVATILKLLRERDSLKIVNDQIGSPTYTVDLARAIKQLINVKPAFGIYNICNSGYCSWFDFSKEIARLSLNVKTTIQAVPSEEFPRPAKRPKNSRLNTTKLSGLTDYKLRFWMEALFDYCSDGGKVSVPR